MFVCSNMFIRTLLFLIGSLMTVKSQFPNPFIPQELEPFRTCVRQFNLTEIDAFWMMYATEGADEKVVVAEQGNKCFVDCVGRESGYLNADDEFNASKFIGEVMSECAQTVDNWDGWDRTNECEKGYLFFKCKTFGEKVFKDWIEQQRKATGDVTSDARIDM